MATKRRRLKNKKKNNRKTKKGGGVNPFKSLGNIIDNAADKFITPEAARGLAGLSKTPDNIEMKSLQQSSAATTQSALPEVETRNDGVVKLKGEMEDKKEPSLAEMKMEVPKAKPLTRIKPRLQADESEEEAEEDVSEKNEDLSEEETDVSEVEEEADVSEAEEEAEEEADASETEEEENKRTQEELAEIVKDAEKQQSNTVNNAYLSMLGVAASNVADAIREVAIKLKPKEDKGTVAPMPNVVTPPVLPNSVEDAGNLSLVLRKPDVLKAESGLGETMGDCPSAEIEITEEEDGAFSFKGMTEPKNKDDCNNKRTMLTLHPDKNSDCKTTAKVKFQNFKNFCDRFNLEESDNEELHEPTDDEIQKALKSLNSSSNSLKIHKAKIEKIIANKNIDEASKEELKRCIGVIEIVESNLEYLKKKHFKPIVSIDNIVFEIENYIKELDILIDQAIRVGEDMVTNDAPAHPSSLLVLPDADPSSDTANRTTDEAVASKQLSIADAAGNVAIAVRDAADALGAKNNTEDKKENKSVVYVLIKRLIDLTAKVKATEQSLTGKYLATGKTEDTINDFIKEKLIAIREHTNDYEKINDEMSLTIELNNTNNESTKKIERLVGLLLRKIKSLETKLKVHMPHNVVVNYINKENIENQRKMNEDVKATGDKTIAAVQSLLDQTPKAQPLPSVVATSAVVTAPLAADTTKDKIKQIKKIVNPAIDNLLSKLSPVSIELRKQVTDYKKYTELLTTHHPESKSGGGPPDKPTMAELAKNVMDNGFIIGIERPIDDETYKEYEYSNYKIFAYELEKSTEPEAKNLLADFKDNELKYKEALKNNGLTTNEKMRLIVDNLDLLEEDTNGGSIIIRNYAIHTTKGKVPDIINRCSDVKFLKERRIELQKEIIRILKTDKPLSNPDYVIYLTLKRLFEWLKPKYVLYHYKLDGEPLFISFGEDFPKDTFPKRFEKLNNTPASIDVLIDKKIMTYDASTDNGLIDNLKCYKKGKTKCNESEYLELEKFPEQLKQLITDENGSLAPTREEKEINKHARTILDDYTKKYAKKYTRKNKQSSSTNMTLKNQPPNQVIIRPNFDSAIESDLMIGYDKDKVPFDSAAKLLIITINKNGVMINNQAIKDKGVWDAARKEYLGFGPSPDDFKLPEYTAGELKFIVDLEARKIAAYINGSKEILINNSKQLDEFKSAVNSVKKSVFSFR